MNIEVLTIYRFHACKIPLYENSGMKLLDDNGNINGSKEQILLFLKIVPFDKFKTVSGFLARYKNV